MLKTYLLPIFCCLVISLQAQQQHQYTQYMYNKLLINPAYAGSRDVPSISAIYRNQWYAFDGAPRSAMLSFHSPFLSKKVGVGAILSHNSIGFHRDIQFTFGYAYNIIRKENFSLRVGLSGAVRSLSISLDEADPFTPLDPSLDNERVKQTVGVFGAGIYASWPNKLYVGISAPRINTSTIGINTTPGVTTAKEVPHYYATGGGVIPLSENVNLLPAVLFKYVPNAPLDADINLNIEINKKFTTGLSYRVGGDRAGESLDLLLYWQFLPQVGVGAAYDFTLSNLRDYAGGSFELLLQADLKKQKHNMSNPRFFL